MGTHGAPRAMRAKEVGQTRSVERRMVVWRFDG